MTLSIVIVVLDQLTKSINGYANHGQFAPLAVLLTIALVAPGTRMPVEVARAEVTVWLSRLALVVPYTYIGLNRTFREAAGGRRVGS